MTKKVIKIVRQRQRCSSQFTLRKNINVADITFQDNSRLDLCKYI